MVFLCLKCLAQVAPHIVLDGFHWRRGSKVPSGCEGRTLAPGDVCSIRCIEPAMAEHNHQELWTTAHAWERSSFLGRHLRCIGFVWPIRRRPPIVSRLSGLYIVCLPLLFSFLVYTSSVSHCLLSPLAYTSSVSHYFANLPQCGPEAQGLTCCQQHRVDLYRFNQRQENARRQKINSIQKYVSRQMRRQTCNLPSANNDG